MSIVLLTRMLEHSACSYMILQNRFYKPALIALAVVMLCGVSKTQQWLNHDREALGFTRLTPLQNAPPMLAFTTVALGGFRGLIANILWIRASDLQEQEKFFEMVQLADWITKLEPHYVQVWLNQAWNMAFNISVKFASSEDRWRWVQRGISLLRDQGLVYNPDEALIYRELSWMYQFKMGANLDDANQFYKQSWFLEMQDLFKGKPNLEQLINPTTPEAIQRLQILTHKYRLNPKTMLEVDNEYGPLEWRLPDAHAIYWAELGRRLAKPKDKESLRRSIYQSMQQACYGGSLTEIGKDRKAMVIGPNFDLVEKVNNAYETFIAEEPDSSQAGSMRASHRNFLLTIIYFLYADGHVKEAQKWFNHTRKTYPQFMPPNYTLDVYAIERLGVQLAETDRNKTTAAIKGILRQAYVALAQDLDDKAVNLDKMAQKAWDYYDSKIPKSSDVRVGLDPMPVLKRIVLDEVLAPETGMSPEFAAILRSKLNLPTPASTASANSAPKTANP